MAFIKKGGKRFERSGRSSFGGKPSFGKKPWSGNYSDARSSDAPSARYKATCSKCGDSCEVPFKPVNGKPVFCRNCFVKTGDTDRGGRAGDRFPRKDYRNDSYTRTTVAAPRIESSSNTEVLKQLQLLNSKLDRLIKAIEGGDSK